jgi:hypothetical protein
VQIKAALPPTYTRRQLRDTRAPCEGINIVWVAVLVAINAGKYQGDQDDKGSAMFLSSHSVTSNTPSCRYEYMSTCDDNAEYKYALKRVINTHVGCL